MATDVFVVGALHLDVIVNAPRLPRIDETLVGKAVAYRLGGKGGNQALAASRMGARVAMAGSVGADEFGKRLLLELDRSGVDRSQVKEAEGSSGMSVAIVDAQGNYGAVIVSGANAEIIPGSFAIPSETKVLLLQLEVPLKANMAALSAAPADCVTVLNAAPVRGDCAELMAKPDLLVVNRIEAESLSGLKTGDFSPRLAAERLAAYGARNLVVTLGREGVFGLNVSGIEFHQPAYNVRVCSTHGAGDEFIGAFAAEIARGREMADAIAFGQAAAALAVSTEQSGRLDIEEKHVRGFLAARRC